MVVSAIQRPNLLSAILVTGGLVIALFARGGEPVAAHGGGLDSYGCHNDRKAGTYHCHRGPCQGKKFDSKTEMLRDACSRSQP